MIKNNGTISIEGVYLCQGVKMDNSGSPIILGLIGRTLTCRTTPLQFSRLHLFGAISSSFPDKKTIEVTILDENEEAIVPFSSFNISNTNNTYSMFTTLLPGNISFNYSGTYSIAFRQKGEKLYFYKQYFTVKKVKPSDFILNRIELPNGIVLPLDDKRFMSRLKNLLDEFNK